MATFPGTNANDTLLGGADNDSIQGFQGNDYLVGNAGNDTILGAKGDDVIYGGDGNDSLVGAQNNDIVQGGAGNDTLDETGDTGVMNTTTGEFLPGGSNLLAGNAGNDTIWGGTGSDTIQGGQGNDLLLGNGGNDAIYTGMGTDIVFGGQGGDTINIASNNTATTLYYNTSMTNVDGVDTINGFVVGTDKIKLITLDSTANQKLTTAQLDVLAITGTSLSTAIANALTSQETDGTDRILTLDNGTTLIFKGVGADLTGSDFVGFTGQVLTVSTPSVAEGNSGTSSLTFSLTLSSPPAVPLTVNYQTLTTGTATAGTDFSAANSSVIFAAGETTKTVTINVIGDTTSESDETVKVQFSGTGIDTVTATGTITNDDAAAPTFTLTSDKSTVQEGTAVTFTVTASSAVSADTALTYNILGDATGGLTAATGTDFGTISGTVTILSGATTGTFTVTPTSDGVVEGLEGFKVSLYDSNLTNVATSTARAITDGASSGSTFALTTSSDTITGSAGNDSIAGSLAFASTGLAASATFTPGDQIDGGQGTDTFTVTVSGSDVATSSNYTSTPSLSNVEKLLVSNLASDTDSPVIFDLSLAGTSLTNIGTTQSTSTGVTTKFTNVPSLLATEMGGRGDLNVAFSSTVVSGSADALTHTLNSVGTSGIPATFTTAGIETLNLVSSTAANNVILADVAMKALNVSGTKSAFIDANVASNTSLTTVNASTATGAVSVDVSDTSAVTGVTLGSAGGTIYYGSNLTGGAQTVTGGSGSADTLAISYTPASAVTLSTAAKAITGIERLEVTSTATGTNAGTNAVSLNSITGISTVATGNVSSMSYNFGDAAESGGAETITLTMTVGINGTSISATTTALPSSSASTVIASAFKTAINALGLSGIAADNSGSVLTLSSPTNSGINVTTAFAVSKTAGTGTYTPGTAAAVSRATYDDLFSNLAANSTLEIHGGAGGQEVTGVSLDKVSATLKDGSGSADAMTVNLKAGAGSSINYTTGTLTVDSNLELLTLNSGGTLATANSQTINVLTAPAATQLTITGDSNLVIGATTSSGVLKTVNSSTLIGNLSYTTTAVATDLTITGGAGNDTIALGATLNNKDIIDAGMGVKDVVTGTSSTWTSTTGALNIANAETINLTTTGTNSINAAGITNATLLAMTDGTNTITGLAAGVAIGVGLDADSSLSSTINVSLANATGATDALTFNINNAADGNTAATLVTTGIEGVTLAVGASANAAAVNLAGVTASTITVTGGLAGTVLTTNGSSAKLNTATTTFDASAFLGNVLVDATSSSKAVTLSANGSATTANTLVGSASASSIFNISENGATVPVVTGGTGAADVLNLAVKTGFADTGSITAIETINFTVRGGDTVTIDTSTGENAAKTINVLGGNSLSEFVTGTLTDTPSLVDASSFAGKLTSVFGVGVLDSTVTVKGGALTTDNVTASYGATSTYLVKMSGVETLNVTGSEAVNPIVDLTNVTGLTTVSATESNTQTLKISGLAAGVGVTAIQGNAGSILQLVLADASGTADALTVTTGSSLTTGAKLVIADVETLTIKSSTGAYTYDLSGVTMTSSSATDALKVTGDKALTISALGTAVTSIDASGMDSDGSVTLNARALNSAMTFTGSSGNDTMFLQNSADVLNAGGGTSDILKVSSLGSALASGIFVVDLSSTTDQVTTYNGTANSAVQVGFENVDLSGLASTTTFGGQIIAASTGSTIVGTINTDNITGGNSVDNITGGAGADILTGGAGADIYVYGATIADSSINTTAAAAAGYDVVNVAAGDIFDLNAAVTVFTAATVLSGVAFAATGTRVIEQLDTAFDGGDDGHANVEAMVISFIGGEKFLVADVDSDETITAADQIIQLIGTVTGTVVSAANIAIA